MSTSTSTPAHLIAWLASFPTDHPASAVAADLHERLIGALTSAPNGTMRAWFQRHDGRTVDTLQATVGNDGRVSNVWTPSGRLIDASRASSVSLNGSTRDYARCRVIAAGDNALIVATPWGDDATQLCAYFLAS